MLVARLGEPFRHAARRRHAPHVVLGHGLKTVGVVDPLPIRRPGWKVIVLPWPPHEDLPGVAAGTVGDKHGIARVGREVHEPCAVGRPHGVDGPLAQEGPWCASGQRHDPQPTVGDPVDPDLGSVGRESNVAVGPGISPVRRARREVHERAGAHLLEPDVEWPAAIGHEGHESSIGRDRRIQLAALEVGERNERRPGQQVVDRRRRRPQPQQSGQNHQDDHRGSQSDPPARLIACDPRRGRGRGRARIRQHLQAECEVARRLEAHLACLLQTAGDDALQRRRHLGGQGLGWLLFQDRRHHVGRRLAGERRPAGQHFVEHRADAEDVGAGIDVFAADLFR